MDDILRNGLNAPEGERPDPSTSQGQSPGEPEIYDNARVIAAVVMLGLDPKTLDIFEERAFVGNTYRSLATAIREFVKRYNRVPSFKEYSAIVADEKASGLIERVSEFVVEFEDLTEAERQPVIDRLVSKIERRRLRDALLDAREAMDRDGGLEEAREILAKATAPATTATSTAPTTAFKPMKLRDLMLNPPPQPDWILPPYLQRGQLVVLSGYAKTGKSTFAYPLAIQVMQGEPFLGFTPTRRTKVLILAVEESLTTAYTRLTDFGGVGAQDLDVHVGALRNDAATLAAIEAFIVANNIGLVLVDTLSRFWQVWQENDARMVDRELSPLLDIARRTNACVLLLHHDGKGEASKGIRGSSVIADIADLLLTMKRPDDRSPIREITAQGRGDFPTELTVTYDRDSRLWSLVSSAEVGAFVAQAALQPESLRSRIVTAIANARRGMNPAALASALEAPLRSIERELSAMRRAGLVLSSRGTYTLPTDGATEMPEPTGRARRLEDGDEA